MCFVCLATEAAADEG